VREILSFYFPLFSTFPLFQFLNTTIRFVFVPVALFFTPQQLVVFVGCSGAP
jgi:hypothetical protein